MKTLIVDDDLTCRLLLQELLSRYGKCKLVVNGKEAVTAVCLALEEFKPYDLVCMDIMMPEMDGQQALKEIRALEEAKGVRRRVKIMMTTARTDRVSVMEALRERCDCFLAKPIHKAALLDRLREMNLIH